MSAFSAGAHRQLFCRQIIARLHIRFNGYEFEMNSRVVLKTFVWQQNNNVSKECDKNFDIYINNMRNKLARINEQQKTRTGNRFLSYRNSAHSTKFEMK